MTETSLNESSTSLLSFRVRNRCDACHSESCRTLAEMPFDSGAVSDFLASYYEGRIDPIDLSGGSYVVMRCNDCGFLWQRDVLEDKGLIKLYETWIDSTQSHAKANQKNNRSRLRIQSQILLVQSLFDSVSPNGIDVLDFGMGWGTWCEAARTFGLNATGAELSDIRIRHARSRGLEVVELPLQNRRFHFINTEQVFEHIADPLPVLEMLSAHMAPKGILRISVPNAKKFLKSFNKETWVPGKDALHPLEHVNGFDHNSLVTFARNAGLVPVAPKRFIKALVRSSLANGLVAPRYLAELLDGQMRGAAIWFERSDSDE